MHNDERDCAFDYTSPTAHLGVGAKIELNDKIYLRPEARVLWLEQIDHARDWEATIGLGFNIGK